MTPLVRQQDAAPADALAPIERVLWIGFLLLVPISSSPLLPFGSGTLVRPLAIVPAGLLLLTAAFRMAILRQSPRIDWRGFVLLFLFLAYITVSGLMRISHLPDEAFKGQTPLDSFVRALVTFAAGLAFYVVARLYIRTADDIRTAIRCLFVGMTASVVLAAFQIMALAEGGAFLRAVQAVTDLFAVHYNGLINRAQGMTFEPSWLATQIIVFLIPPLIASSISGQEFVDVPARKGRAFRLGLGFGIAALGLLCSGSRFGLGAIVVMLVASSLMAARSGRFLASIILAGILLAGGGAMIVMRSLETGAGAGYVIGPVLYLASGQADSSGADAAAGISDTLALSGRVAGAQAATDMWLDHPLFGVSFGNDFRYFGHYAPDWAFATILFTGSAHEGASWLDPYAPEKGNARNFFIRLLAETGIIGFVLFTVFLLRQIYDGPPHDNYHRYFRAAGAMALTFSFINQDSVADTVFWLPIV
ncbi:MAG TPA: O-antigen ligase family protein, partial [Rhizomicrobium sp.]|nr:O-antigen ligase family protein [Rhizomicrobium sp.]